MQISVLLFRTSRYLLKAPARVKEDVLERNKSKLGAVTSLESTMVGNREISIEDHMSRLFLLLISGSFKIVKVL